MKKWFWILVAVAGMVLAAACSGKSTPDATSGTSAPTATAVTRVPSTATAAPSQAAGSPSAVATPTATLPPFQPATTVASGPGTATSGQPILSDVRVGKNDGYDRIVFEFQGPALPSYEVKYVQSVSQCGSGKPVTTSGAAQLSITFRPAAAHDSGGNATVASNDIVANLQSIKEAKPSCDFEGVVAWVVGTVFRPYRVIELQNPTRLAIDIQQ
jgi:hypothetical protein